MKDSICCQGQGICCEGNLLLSKLLPGHFPKRNWNWVTKVENMLDTILFANLMFSCEAFMTEFYVFCCLKMFNVAVAVVVGNLTNRHLTFNRSPTRCRDAKTWRDTVTRWRDAMTCQSASTTYKIHGTQKYENVKIVKNDARWKN